MIKMKADDFKDTLIKKVHFNEPITITDTFDFDRTIDKKIRTLPNNLTVDEIEFSNSMITSLPSNFKVNKLWLGVSKIRSLPNDLSVRILDLGDSGITYIPLTIKNVKTIYVNDNFLLSIPYDLFLTYFLLFKNIIKIYFNFNNLVSQQFEQRLLLGM